jgi:F-type H+-transporting ATPase subunit b
LALLLVPVAMPLALVQAAEQGTAGGEAPDLGHGPAAAATDDPEVADHGDAAHGAPGEEQGAGLPQLDVSTFPSQIFWLILTFGTLYYLMTRKALPRLSEILEARQERIASDLDRAATLRAEADAALRRHQQVVADAQAKAAAQLKEVEDRLMAEAAQKQVALDADLARQLAEAEARIKSAKDAALAEVQTVAAEVAQSAVQRLTGLKMAQRDVKAALDKVLGEAA